MLKNSLLIMTQCSLHSLYYIIVFFIFYFFTPESTQSDGRGSRSIRWLHINTSVLLFLPRFTRTAGSFVIDFFFPPPPFPSLLFPSPPRLQITPAPPLIPLGVRCKEKRKKEKRGQLHLRLPKQVYHCLGALSRLVNPLTWNAPMRQSGATGAWRLAAGRDNLPGDTQRGATTEDF